MINQEQMDNNWTELMLIIDKYFDRENILISHQIESYNDLIDNIIPKILSVWVTLQIEIN